MSVGGYLRLAAVPRDRATYGGSMLGFTSGVPDNLPRPTPIRQNPGGHSPPSPPAKIINPRRFTSQHEHLEQGRSEIVDLAGRRAAAGLRRGSASRRSRGFGFLRQFFLLCGLRRRNPAGMAIPFQPRDVHPPDSVAGAARDGFFWRRKNCPERTRADCI